MPGVSRLHRATTWQAHNSPAQQAQTEIKKKCRKLHHGYRSENRKVRLKTQKHASGYPPQRIEQAGCYTGQKYIAHRRDSTHRRNYPPSLQHTAANLQRVSSAIPHKNTAQILSPLYSVQCARTGSIHTTRPLKSCELSPQSKSPARCSATQCNQALTITTFATATFAKKQSHAIILPAGKASRNTRLPYFKSVFKSVAASSRWQHKTAMQPQGGGNCSIVRARPRRYRLARAASTLSAIIARSSSSPCPVRAETWHRRSVRPSSSK